MSRTWLHCWLLSLIASVIAVSAACGQGDGLGDSLGAVGEAGNAAEQGNIVVSAEFTAATDTTPARLFITAEIDPGWHTFSLTQPKGGPLASKITLVASEDFKLLADDFTPAPPPEVKFTWPGKPDLPIEEHVDSVTWYLPIELASGVDPDKLTIEGKLRAQRCDESSACLPPKNFGFAARLGPGIEVPDEKPVAAAPEPATGDLPLDGLRNLINGGQAAEKPAPQGNIALTARFTQPDADGRAELLITADIEPGWHTFAVTQPKGGPVTTTITLAESDQYRLLADQFTPSPPPHVKYTWPKQPELAVEEHSGQVTWSAPIEIAQGVDPATLAIAGKVRAQRCDEGSACLPPTSFEFAAKLGDADAAFAAAPPSSPSDRGEPGTATASPGGLDFNQINQHARRGELTLALRVVFAFLGGMLLNVMPCVLPVIGLKIMSFVQQSGHDRGKVFLLNVAYALGIMAVFMLLAGLAVLAGLGWGDLFRRPAFVIGMTGIVFAMGLSLLGVWEIPIPGFAGGSKVNDLARQEGLSGAFYKGIITTILATPCTGPFLGSGIAVSAATPAYVTLISFAAAGLGMASPYILIGAFPKLIRFLPKPGEWMDTFKQCMGFLMLGAVVYFLTTIPATAVIPTVALLIGLWAACWWIGRTPITAETGEKTRAWLWAGAFAVAIGWLAFGWLQPEMIARQDRTTQRKIDVAVNEALAEFQTLAGGPVDGARTPGALPHQGESELAWQPFTKARLEQLTRDQKTVLVDFTADWCLVCQVLAGTVLNTEDTRQLVEANGVVPLLADWTNYESDQEVDAMLEALGSKQVPTLAIFPAGRPNEPIVIRGTYTKARLAELLKQAGPSQTAAVGSGEATNVAAKNP